MKKRNASMDYLKILSIILIVLFHYFWNGKYDWSKFNGCQRVLVDIFFMFGELGVNCFALISGYYLSTSQKPFRIKKLRDLILQVLVYSILSAIVIHTQIRPYTISTGTILSIVMPVTTKVWWYISAYVVLYLFTPYINRCIDHLTREEYKRLLVVLILVYSVLPTVLGTLTGNPEAFLYYNRCVWLAVLYCVAGYIRRYGDTWTYCKIRKPYFWLGIHAITWIVVVTYIILMEKFPGMLGKDAVIDATYFWPPNTVLMLILSVSVFMFFSSIELKGSKISTFLSSATLGIYMSHGGRSGSIWWNRIFHKPAYQGSWMVFADAFLALIVIFSVGVCIELVRQGIQRLCGYTIDLLSPKKE